MTHKQLAAMAVETAHYCIYAWRLNAWAAKAALSEGDGRSWSRLMNEARAWKRDARHWADRARDMLYRQPMPCGSSGNGGHS